MITRFSIRNFKRLEAATLELGNASVFIGPNNSGKTTALQALALWDIGWRRWAEKRDKGSPAERTGVAINRRDLYAIPLPSAKLLWRDLHTREIDRSAGKQKTDNVYITLSAEGVHNDRPWVCALEFYYANEESIYCRLKEGDNGLVPEGARKQPVVFLPPMSGLAEREHRKEPGEISVLIGEGQTAQVLRNLCWQLHSRDDKDAWRKLVRLLAEHFRVELQNPTYVKERAELTLSYRETLTGVDLDLSSSGRGFQQVCLLLSYMLANPGAVLLLDEPDAHLEILRQRDVYNLLTDMADESDSQIIAASHSEVVLQEAGERDVVVAFVGNPHRVDTHSRRSQVRKALERIRLSDYYMAEQHGWVLLLEGSTDLAILRQLSMRLQHPSRMLLHDSVPAIYLGGNQPSQARDQFHGLREAKHDLVGLALLDRVDTELRSSASLSERMWSRCEIENYLTTRASLNAFVQLGLRSDDLLENAERQRRLEVLQSCIDDMTNALRLTNKPDPWGPDIKVTDEFLDPLFKNYYERLGTPQRTYKRDYHGLAAVIPIDEIDTEVVDVLDEISAVAGRAKPFS